MQNRMNDIITPKQVIEDYAENRRISVPDIGVNKTVIISWLPHIVDKLRINFQATKNEHWLYKNNPLYSNTNISIGHIRPGASAAAIYIEQIIACGAEKIICVGYAGSLVERVNVGDVIVPTWFISTEGTSKHYCNSDSDIVPTLALLELIRSNDRSKSFRYGGCWSTDALFRETQSDIEKNAEAGAFCVDMESSASIAVGKYRSVEICSLLIVSDAVWGGKWKKGFDSPQLLESIDNVVKLLGEIV